VSNWLFTMDNLFAAQTHFTQPQMVAYATSYLTEEALSWWQVARSTGEEQPKTWDALKEALRAYFQSPTKVGDAKNKLYDLSQTGGAEGFEEYMAEFQKLLIHAKLSDEDEKVHLFLRGLSSFASGLVSVQQPATLKDAMAYASKIESSFKRPSQGQKRGKDTSADPGSPSPRNSNTQKTRFGGTNSKRHKSDAKASKKCSASSSK
jgi:Retrotransposon gag protein